LGSVSRAPGDVIDRFAARFTYGVMWREQLETGPVSAQASADRKSLKHMPVPGCTGSQMILRCCVPDWLLRADSMAGSTIILHFTSICSICSSVDLSD
jgi:hypothetical protein